MLQQKLACNDQGPTHSDAAFLSTVPAGCNLSAGSCNTVPLPLPLPLPVTLPTVSENSWLELHATH
jgi:hypothetical protein